MERKIVTLDDIERRHIADHRAAFYAWIKHITTLSSTILTALVALQKYYIPETPEGLILLQLCWGSLALCIVLGLVALYGESQTLLDAAIDLRKVRLEYGDQYAAHNLANGKPIYPRRFFSISQKLLPYCFALALFSLALFAILNLQGK